MSSRRAQLRKQRIKLWEKDPHCFYCKCITELPPYGPRAKLQDNHATIEHLYSRLDEKRRSPNHNHEQRRVLACYKCNTEKGRERERMLGIDEIRRRSKRFPKKVDNKPKPWYFRLYELFKSLGSKDTRPS